MNEAIITEKEEKCKAHYRVRTRFECLNGCYVVVADNIRTLEEAYKKVAEEGRNTARVYYIDKIEPKLFSRITARVARKRLEEIQVERRENAET